MVPKEVIQLRKARLLIQLPLALKQRLDSLKREGYTASGFIRALLEREFNQQASKRKGG